MTSGAVFVVLLILALVIALYEASKKKKKQAQWQSVIQAFFKQHPEIIPNAGNEAALQSLFQNHRCAVTLDNAEEFYRGYFDCFSYQGTPKYSKPEAKMRLTF
jgi:hypothetical protein